MSAPETLGLEVLAPSGWRKVGRIVVRQVDRRGWRGMIAGEVEFERENLGDRFELTAAGKALEALLVETFQRGRVDVWRVTDAEGRRWRARYYLDTLFVTAKAAELLLAGDGSTPEEESTDER